MRKNRRFDRTIKHLDFPTGEAFSPRGRGGGRSPLGIPIMMMKIMMKSIITEYIKLFLTTARLIYTACKFQYVHNKCNTNLNMIV
jgi:hypothetical protein